MIPFNRFYNSEGESLEKSTIHCEPNNKNPHTINNIVIKSEDCNFKLNMKLRGGIGKLTRAKMECVRPHRFNCDRDCSISKPTTCIFNLQLVSLMSDTDGYRADGRTRSILGFKRTDPKHESVSMPGPPIVMCEGDVLELNLQNQLSGK